MVGPDVLEGRLQFLPDLGVEGGGLRVGVGTGGGRGGASSSESSRRRRRVSRFRSVRQVFVAILYSHVVKALSPLNPFRLRHTVTQTSWLASEALPGPRILSATR